MPEATSRGIREFLLHPSADIAAAVDAFYPSCNRRKIVQYDQVMDVVRELANRPQPEDAINQLVDFHKILIPIFEDYSEKHTYGLALDNLL